VEKKGGKGEKRWKKWWESGGNSGRKKAKFEIYVVLSERL
jgi:hypothetical protein